MFYLLTANKPIRPSSNYAIGDELLKKIDHILDPSSNTSVINNNSNFLINNGDFNIINKNKN